MSHYGDLTKYVYTSGFRRPKTLNVGWLDGRHSFETARPARWLILKLWDLCQYCLLEDRGSHECNLSDCLGPAKTFKTPNSVGGHQKERRIQAKKDFLRKALLSSRLSSSVRIYFAEELAALDQGLKNPARGYAKTILGVHPDSGDRIELGSAEIRVFGDRGKIYAAPNMIYHYVTSHHYKPPSEFVQALKNGPSPPHPEYLHRLAALRLPLSLVQSYERAKEAEKLEKAARRQKSV